MVKVRQALIVEMMQVEGIVIHSQHTHTLYTSIRGRGNVPEFTLETGSRDVT